MHVIDVREFIEPERITYHFAFEQISAVSKDVGYAFYFLTFATPRSKWRLLAD